jgi:hypothetical protein
MDLAYEEWDETRHWRKESGCNTAESLLGLGDDNVMAMLGHSVFGMDQN